MPIQTDSLNRKLYDLLNSRGYNPIPRDSDVNNAGKTVAPEEADVFKFTFKQNDKDIDDVWATVDGAENLTLYYDNNIASKAKAKSASSQFDDSWYGLLNFLKKWAHSRQLSFNLEPKEKIDSDMAQRTYMKKKEQIAEGYYPMGKSASYNDNIPTVKIILQHTRQIQEGEQRYRNVAKIFLENTQGERILAPTVKPGIAQIYARHLAEGGVPNDERWNHIKSLCEEYTKMAGFVRAVRGNQFNESAQRLVEAGLNHYTSLRESLGRMRGHRGYTAYFESWTPTLMENEGDESTLNELFVQETLDPRIESVMPILNKLSKNLGEMKEVKELEEWAEGLLEAPGAETLAHNQQTELKRMKALDMDESEDAEAAHKKSQVPAFMRKQSGDPDWKTTTQDLEKAKERNISGKEGLAALKQRAGIDEESDMQGDPKSHQAQTTLKHLKKASYGDRADAANIKPGIAGYRDRIDMLQRAEKEGNLKEEDVEESGLQAYLGNKKYGKDGMDALRKAGRDGASKEKMANIRAKYDKLDEEGEFAGDYATGPAGQWRNKGPKANKPATVGDLVGEGQLNEMDKSQPSSDRGGESSGNPYAKGGKATPVKAKDAEKDAEKALNKSMDKAHKKDVKEGQDDLDAILRIIRK